MLSVRRAQDGSSVGLSAPLPSGGDKMLGASLALSNHACFAG